jgi:hypothetical protein
MSTMTKHKKIFFITGLVIILLGLTTGLLIHFLYLQPHIVYKEDKTYQMLHSYESIKITPI